MRWTSKATPADSIWVVNAYQLALVACLLPFASLGEILGYRRVYQYGLALFTLASLFCALSWSLGSLTAARVLQGVGAAGIMSVNTGADPLHLPCPRTRAAASGLNAMVVGTFTAIGPTIAAGILSVASVAMAVRHQRAGRCGRDGVGGPFPCPPRRVRRTGSTRSAHC